MNERILIIDTSHRQAVVAVAQASRVLAVRNLEESRRHARDLAPCMGELLRTQNWRHRDLTAVIAGRGPGSYTGLRVGLMSAKMLAYATGCTLVGVHSFAAIARQAPTEARVIDVIADAQQDKVYVQRFMAGQEGPLTIEAFDAWRERLPPETWISGPGLERWGGKIPAAARQVARADWLPRADSLLAIGQERLQRGERDDPFTLEPLYLRASSAEEKFAIRQPSGVRESSR